MSDDEIQALIQTLNVSDDVARGIFLIVKEMQRKTLHKYFQAIQQANQAAELEGYGYKPKPPQR
jgi:hypothetical protein